MTTFSPWTIASLITPHGDWKRLGPHIDPSERCRLITPHGDWKPAGRSIAPRTSASSLPLMGIGNLIVCFLVLGTSAFSFPIMGIGNLDRRCHALPDDNLITPHGDWKRARPLDSDRAALRRLITPHGDWKPDQDASSCPLCDASLPLMGIGNSSSQVMPGRSPRLITPHGDWKPVIEQRPMRSLCVSSLPLMGIGNF